MAQRYGTEVWNGFFKQAQAGGRERGPDLFPDRII